MTTWSLDLDGLSPREREHRMLRAVVAMATGQLRATEVSRPVDLRQLAYLASLARGRCPDSRRLMEFARVARERLALVPAPETPSSPDPLQVWWGAPWSLDVGKVRSELPAYFATEAIQAA